MRSTAADAVVATGGRLLQGDPGAGFDGATQDSRRVRRGQLFVPLRDVRDGHDFIPAAVAAGAAGYLTAVGAVAGTDPAFAIGVDDPYTALVRLARAAGDRIATVVAITGSVGKTTTKDLLAAILRRSRRVAAAEGSFNNEIGMPLTLLGVDEDDDVALVEIGARLPGDVRWGAELCRPDVGVVTTVGTAHLGIFGSRDAIAATKGELVEALGAGAVAVLNADDARVAAMAARTDARVVRFGSDPGADVVVRDVRLEPDLTARFTIAAGGETADCVLEAAGIHLVTCAAAAAAAAWALGAPVADVAPGLAAAQRSAHRMQLVAAEGGWYVLNDAYNANPESMAAAVASARHLADATGGRLLALVGHMAELGDAAPELHRELGAQLRDLDVVVVVAVGEHADLVADAAVADAAAGAALLVELAGGLRRDDVVVVKASRVVELETAIPLLLAPGRVADHEEERR